MPIGFVLYKSVQKLHYLFKSDIARLCLLAAKHLLYINCKYYL